MKSTKMIFLMGVLMAFGLMVTAPVISRADDTMMKDNAVVAISGYCPVCLIHGMAMKGSDNFTTEYKGKVYKFSSIEMQKEFINNPDEVASQDLDAKYKALMKK